VADPNLELQSINGISKGLIAEDKELPASGHIYCLTKHAECSWNSRCLMIVYAQSVRGTNITIDTLCGIMSDDSRGDEVERYAAVNNLILNTYEQKCQDFKYANMISELSQTNWNGSASEGGM